MKQTIYNFVHNLWQKILYILPNCISSLIASNEYIFFGILGAVMENFLFLTIAAKNCPSIYHLGMLGLLLSIVSFIFDMSILLVMRFTWKKYKKNTYELSDFWKRTGILIMIFYRFIPFARFPALFLVVKHDMKQIIILNLIGSFIANFFCLSMGFFILK